MTAARKWGAAVRTIGGLLTRASIAIAAVLTLASPLRALEPEEREAIVISGRVWEGSEYREVFVPSTKDAMTVIAGQESAIVYVRTLEYYWPLSRQIHVDFARQREIVEGELVIRRDGAVIGRETLQPYAVLYPEGAVSGQATLLWGEEAERAFTEYQEGERRFAREFAELRRAHTAYERAMVDSRAARLPGQPVEPLDPPPPLPEPSLRLVTKPEAGLRLSLEPGAYSMVLERDGQPVPGTERRVWAVAVSDSETLVADIVPAERWTRPLASSTPAARIYARPGAIFYMTLAEASRFDEAEYLPVVDPQAQPVAGRPLFIRRQPAPVDELAIDWNETDRERLRRQSLKVDQTRGSSYGYAVRAARDGEKPDLDAFTIEVPADPSTTRGLIVRANPNEIPFEREVVVVHPRRTVFGLLLALLPLAGYGVLAGFRRLRPRLAAT